MQDFSALINTGLTVFSVASLAAYGFQRGTVKSLREDLTDADRRYNVIKEEQTNDRTELAEVKSDLSALQRVVTGEVHWVALGTQLEDHHHQAMDGMGEIKDLLAKLVEREANG